MPSSAGTATANKLMITDASNSIQSINQIGFNSMLYNGTIVTATGTELNYLHGVTPGTATASNAIVLDSSRNIGNIGNLTATNLYGTIQTASQPNITTIGNLTGLTMFGDISMSGHNISSANTIGCTTLSVSSAFNITSTTDSTSVSTGSFTTLGGIGIAKSLFVGTGIVIPNASGGDMITLTSTSSAARNTIKFITDAQTFEIGTRGSTAANPNSFYIYNGSYKLLLNPTGDTSILSTTDSSSASTGCLKLSGGLGVVKNMYCTGTLTLDRNGSNLAFTNGSNSGLIELAASPNILRAVNGYAVNIGASGITIASGSSAAARYPIDLQAVAGDIQLCFFQSGSNAAYAIGANNSALEFHSGSAFNWYAGTTGNGSLGTNLLNLTNAGTLTSTQNLIATCGVHASTFSTAGLAALGNSAHMHFAASTGSFFTYNYNTGVYGNTMIGNNSLASCSNGWVNINTSSFSQNCPLAVFGSNGFTRVTGFGYLASSGSGTAVGFTNRPFSIYSEWGIIVGSGEIDVFSDLRMKKEVLPLNDDLCYQFIQNIDPIQFKYTHDEDREHYGYGAQQLMAYGFTTLVGTTHADEPLPEEKIPTYIPDFDGKLGDMKLSGETIDLPGDVRLCVSMIDMIPILHKCIQKQQKRLDEQQSTIDELKALIINNVHMSNDNVHISEPTPTLTEPAKRNRIFIKKKIRL